MFIKATLELYLLDRKWRGGRSQLHSCHVGLRWIIRLAEKQPWVTADWMYAPCAAIGGCGEKGIIT